jgi:hypothetical protein
MFGFLSFLLLLVIAYLLWRVTDQLPDLIFRMSEIQRDVAEIRRTQSGGTASAGAASPSAGASAASTAPAASAPPATETPSSAATGTGDAPAT